MKILFLFILWPKTNLEVWTSQIYKNCLPARMKHTYTWIWVLAFQIEFKAVYLGMMWMTAFNNLPKVRDWASDCRNSSWAPTWEGAQCLGIRTPSLPEVLGGGPVWLLGEFQGTVVPGQGGFVSGPACCLHEFLLSWEACPGRELTGRAGILSGQQAEQDHMIPGGCTKRSEFQAFTCSIWCWQLYSFRSFRNSNLRKLT